MSKPLAEAPAAGPRRRRLALVSGNVVALGTVSLITDVSAEMVTAVLPLYLVLGLHVSPLAYGVIDGVYTGATALLRLVGGFVADRIRSRKLVAGLGYTLSAVAKLGLLLAGRSMAAIGAVIAVDRLGKGVRTAPRDALITASSPPEALGRAFGVHRTMDGIGAFLGPLAALAVLAAAGSPTTPCSSPASASPRWPWWSWSCSCANDRTAANPKRRRSPSVRRPGCCAPHRSGGSSRPPACSASPRSATVSCTSCSSAAKT
ncbi:MFS transporter [Dactylosporangium cerinum]